METFLKLSSNDPTKNCNCISPFYMSDISGINPNTSSTYTNDEKNVIKSTFYRISNAKGCSTGVCCDPNDPFSAIDQNFMNAFKSTYPKIMPIFNGTSLASIKLSTIENVYESGWIIPTPYYVCKITKSTILPTNNPNIFMATNLVIDCFTDQCNSAEQIILTNLLSSGKTETVSTQIDDVKVVSSIQSGDISYVKTYIKKYKQVDSPLTHDNYNNRLIHIAAQSNQIPILDMLIALNAKINITNKNNETPLHLAIKSLNYTNISKIIAQGADLSAITNKGETPMFYAVKTGDIGIIRMIYNAGSAVIGVNKDGNNLIHYCILNCPSLSQTKKIDVIRFLLEHGVNSEQTNKKGETPLILTKILINKEEEKKGIWNKPTEDPDIDFKNIVVETFFNIQTKRYTQQTKMEKFTEQQDISKNTNEHTSLLEIQTLLFNNIIRNNVDKYSGYINVSELPAGSPIDILDTVCIGTNLSCNENSDECIKKGGKLSKIINKTTQIKLELIPETQSAIDDLKQDDLYYDKIPKGTSFNVMSNNSSIIVPTTTGITYPIGESSTNDVPISIPIPVSISIPTSINGITSGNPIPISTDCIISDIPIQTQPPLIDTKSNKEAILNSHKLKTNDFLSFMRNYGLYIMIIIIIIISIIIYTIYKT